MSVWNQDDILTTLYEDCKYNMEQTPCAENSGALSAIAYICWRFDLLDDNEFNTLSEDLEKWNTANSSPSWKPKTGFPTSNSSM